MTTLRSLANGVFNYTISKMVTDSLDAEREKLQ